jgi:hypothetical protein
MRALGWGPQRTADVLALARWGQGDAFGFAGGGGGRLRGAGGAWNGVAGGGGVACCEACFGSCCCTSPPCAVLPPQASNPGVQGQAVAHAQGAAGRGAAGHAAAAPGVLAAGPAAGQGGRQQPGAAPRCAARLADCWGGGGNAGQRPRWRRVLPVMWLAVRVASGAAAAPRARRARLEWAALPAVAACPRRATIAPLQKKVAPRSVKPLHPHRTTRRSWSACTAAYPWTRRRSTRTATPSTSLAWAAAHTAVRPLHLAPPRPSLPRAGHCSCAWGLGGRRLLAASAWSRATAAAPCSPARCPAPGDLPATGAHPPLPTKLGVNMRATAVPNDGSAPQEVLLCFGIIDHLQASGGWGLGVGG